MKASGSLVVKALVVASGVAAVWWLASKLGGLVASGVGVVTGTEGAGSATQDKSDPFFARGDFLEPVQGGGGDVAVFGSTYPMAVELSSAGPELHGDVRVVTIEIPLLDAARTYVHNEVGVVIPAKGKSLVLKFDMESTTAGAEPISALFGRDTLATLYFNDAPLKTIHYTTSGSVAG